MISPSFVTEKCRCGDMEASASEVVPTYCSGATVGTLWRLE